MDNKSVEEILNKIIEIDKNTDEKVNKVKSEIIERQKGLKNIIKSIDEKSNNQQVKQGKELYDSIMHEATLKKEKILSDCQEALEKMDSVFEENKSTLIEKAFEKLSVNRWGS